MATDARSKAICHGYYVLFGMVGVGILPALVRSFEESLDISHGAMGLALGVSAVLMAVSSVAGGVWYDRSGGRTVLLAATIASALTALGLRFVGGMASFVVLMGLFHCANGLGSVVNPLVGQLYADQRARGVNLLHAAQGVGRLLAPLLVTACIALTGGWQPALVLGAALFAAWAAVVGWGLKDPTRPAPTEAARSDTGRAMRDPVVLLGIAAFVLLSGCEIPLITWAPDFLEAEAGFPKHEALGALTAMMMGYTAIRLVIGLGKLRITAPHIVGSVGVLVVSFIGLTHAAGTASLYGWAFALGVSFGPYWPCTAAAIYEYATQAHGTLTGLFNVASTLGAFAAVALVGIIGDRYSLRLGLWVAPVCAALLAASYYAAEHLARRARAGGP